MNTHYNRRKYLATLSALGVSAIAGCSAEEAIPEKIEKSASEAIVTQNGLNETGYEHQNKDEFVIDRELDIKEQTIDVKLTNIANSYSRGRLANMNRFVIASTPNISVAGISANPLDRLDNKDLLDRLSRGIETLKDVEPQGTTKVSSLGEEREVEMFSAVIEQNGREMDVFLHMTKFAHEDDYLIALGGYPQESDEIERDRIYTLIQNVEHPVNTSESTSTEE